MRCSGDASPREGHVREKPEQHTQLEYVLPKHREGKERRLDPNKLLYDLK